MRRTPLRPKRDKPRRNEGRIQHKRMKRTATSMTALEERHVARVKAMACCVSGTAGPSTVHHLMRAPGKRCRRDHQWIVPLRDDLHANNSPISVHGLGTEAKFEAHHKLAPGFLIAWAKREWEATCGSSELGR